MILEPSSQCGGPAWELKICPYMPQQPVSQYFRCTQYTKPVFLSSSLLTLEILKCSAGSKMKHFSLNIMPWLITPITGELIQKHSKQMKGSRISSPLLLSVTCLHLMEDLLLSQWKVLTTLSMLPYFTQNKPLGDTTMTQLIIHGCQSCSTDTSLITLFGWPDIIHKIMETLMKLKKQSYRTMWVLSLNTIRDRSMSSTEKASE